MYVCAQAQSRQLNNYCCCCCGCYYYSRSYFLSHQTHKICLFFQPPPQPCWDMQGKALTYQRIYLTIKIIELSRIADSLSQYCAFGYVLFYLSRNFSSLAQSTSTLEHSFIRCFELLAHIGHFAMPWIQNCKQDEHGPYL